MPKKKDYSDWSKEDLIEHIKKLEKRKKYGLVWDEERTKEEFEERSQNALPVLVGVPELDITTDPSQPTHILIEGDNYHALSVLNYTHEKSVDVIYIDPPYNTGNVSWKYNNRIVDKEDAYRHSKFIAFMEKRIRLSKSILKSTGIFVCAIDDYEIHNVRHLLDEIFGENNRLSTIVVVHNPRGRNDDKYVATMHEYMLVYAVEKELAKVAHFPFSDEEIEQFNKKDEISDFGETPFMRTGNNSNRVDRQKLFYSIYYDPIEKHLSLEKSEHSMELFPINESGEEKTWRWGKETFQRDKDTELIVKTVKSQYRIYKKRRITTNPGSKPTSVWYEPRYDASSHGIMLLQNIFGKKDVFPYPKSLWTLTDTISLLAPENGTIVDFMAGSGTTGHATQMLNYDKGTRQAILCTNNEGNICTDVCRPRLEKSFMGYEDLKRRPVHGLGGNLKYFRTDFVPAEATDENKALLTRRSVEMLCLRESTFDLVSDQSEWKVYKNQTNHTAILFNQRLISTVKNEITGITGPVSVYIFSLGDDDFSQQFEEFGGRVKVCAIPEAILRVYRRIFKE